jgi:hypothetical protein
LKRRQRSSSPEKTYRWSIYRLRGTPAALIGSVNAPNEKAAVKAAIEEFGIDDPAQQKRLLAQRDD